MASGSVLPARWTTYTTNDGLGANGSKRVTLKADSKEFEEVNRLVQKTWQRGKFSLDSDGRYLSHPGIQVIRIDRIENPVIYRLYNSQKEAFLKKSSASTFKGVHTLPGSSGPVKSTECLKSNSSLRRNICSSINEHYLFHGTKLRNVSSIADNGFDVAYSLDRSLLGRALYFAESSTKADMYADHKENRTAGQKYMFLSRVLVGDAHLYMAKKKRGFRQPPCKNCLHKSYYFCPHDRYNSIIGDCRRRPFRIFAVYSSSQCYPEYLITYVRLSRFDVPERIVSDDDSEDDTLQPVSRAAFTQPSSPFLHVGPDPPASSPPPSQTFSSERELASDLNNSPFVSRTELADLILSTAAQTTSQRFSSASHCRLKAWAHWALAQSLTCLGDLLLPTLLIEIERSTEI